MAILPMRDASAGGTVATLDTPAGGGDQIAAGSGAGGWDLGVVLAVLNADTTPTTVTVDGTPFVVGATTGFALIPVRRVVFGTLLNITYSKVTALKVSAFRIAAAP